MGRAVGEQIAGARPETRGGRGGSPSSGVVHTPDSAAGRPILYPSCWQGRSPCRRYLGGVEVVSVEGSTIRFEGSI